MIDELIKKKIVPLFCRENALDSKVFFPFRKSPPNLDLILMMCFGEFKFESDRKCCLFSDNFNYLNYVSFFFACVFGSCDDGKSYIYELETAAHTETNIARFFFQQ